MKVITIDQIHKRISKVKTVSRRQVRRYLVASGADVLGSKTKPRLFPDNAIKIVLKHLAMPETKIPSLKQLLALKHRSQKARGR